MHLIPEPIGCTVMSFILFAVRGWGHCGIQNEHLLQTHGHYLLLRHLLKHLSPVQIYHEYQLLED